MDRTAWNEEVGKLAFQLRAALTGRQSVWLYLHGCAFCIRRYRSEEAQNKSQWHSGMLRFGTDSST